MILRDAQLVLAQHHARRLDAADHGGLEHCGLAAVSIAHTRTHRRERNLLPHFEVWCATNNTVQLAAADIDRRKPQAIGVRVRFDAGDVRDADVVAPIATRSHDRVDRETSHRQTRGQFFRRKTQVNVFAEPLE